MENWELSLDKFLTNPPEQRKSRFRCCDCREELHPDDEYYELDEDIYCSYCAEKWFDRQRKLVSEEQAYGD